MAISGYAIRVNRGPSRAGGIAASPHVSLLGLCFWRNGVLAIEGHRVARGTRIASGASLARTATRRVAARSYQQAEASPRPKDGAHPPCSYRPLLGDLPNR